MNFLIKDPGSKVHRLLFNASMEKMDDPMVFKLHPNSTKEKTYFSDIFTDMDGRECDGAYCTKLVIDPLNSNNPHTCEGSDMCDESAVPKTLAFVMID